MWLEPGTEPLEMLEELLMEDADSHELVLFNLLCEHLITVRARGLCDVPCLGCDTNV